MKSKGIIAYGTDEDRAKLAALSESSQLSGSQWIIKAIRDAHKKLVGGKNA